MQPEDIDKLFRDRLQGHAPTPPAFLWDKLEAELQPARKKRPVMWLYASAAVVALLLLAGGAWLLRTGPQNSAPTDMAAVVSRPSSPAVSQPQPAATQALEKEISTPQATAAPASASTISKAIATATPAPANRQVVTKKASQRRNTTGLAATENRAVAAATPRPAQPERTVKAEPIPSVTPETMPAALASTTASAEPAAPQGSIEVEVRRQTQAPVAVASNAPASRPRLGSIIRQARNALRGDQVNLADAGLPETVTVQARVAGHTLTKVIQL